MIDYFRNVLNKITDRKQIHLILS